MSKNWIKETFAGTPICTYMSCIAKKKQFPVDLRNKTHPMLAGHSNPLQDMCPVQMAVANPEARGFVT